jgi:hypothetical protein
MSVIQPHEAAAAGDRHAEDEPTLDMGVVTLEIYEIGPPWRFTPEILAADAATYERIQRASVAAHAGALRDALDAGPDEPVPYWPAQP